MLFKQNAGANKYPRIKWAGAAWLDWVNDLLNKPKKQKINKHKKGKPNSLL